MFKLPSLPDDILIDVLSTWIDIRDFSFLYWAACNTVERSDFFKLLSTQQQTGIKGNTKEYNNWLLLRNITTKDANFIFWTGIILNPQTQLAMLPSLANSTDDSLFQTALTVLSGFSEKYNDPENVCGVTEYDRIVCSYFASLIQNAKYSSESMWTFLCESEHSKSLSFFLLHCLHHPKYGSATEMTITEAERALENILVEFINQVRMMCSFHVQCIFTLISISSVGFRWWMQSI